MGWECPIHIAMVFPWPPMAGLQNPRTLISRPSFIVFPSGGHPATRNMRMRPSPKRPLPFRGPEAAAYWLPVSEQNICPKEIQVTWMGKWLPELLVDRPSPRVASVSRGHKTEHERYIRNGMEADEIWDALLSLADAA